MFNLPDRTLFNRKIPKSKFYEKLKTNTKLKLNTKSEFNTKIKAMFIEQVDYIVWKHKLSKETINLDPTDEVQEVQVFEIYLKQRKFSKEILENIDKIIPYPILHVMIFEGEAKFAIAYKQRNQNDQDRSVVHSYYESNWQPVKDISINLTNGLDLKAVYENIIRSLMTFTAVVGEDLDATVKRQTVLEKLIRECARLEAKIKREKQFSRKVELNMELQTKKKEISTLSKS